jgi:hypothetical protein
MSAITVKFDSAKLNRTINNIVKYSDGFLSETKQSKNKIALKMGNTSVNAFYQYLDGVARMHPDMLHHIYEWGQVGNPFARLVELNIKSGQGGTVISANFTQSNTSPKSGGEPFYNKAEVMEDGQSVTIQEKDAEVLFFEIDGKEFFRKGPITIENPGGEAVRGSFVKTFNEFYTSYFSQVYLRSIKFYEHFQNPKPYARNFAAAVRSGSAKNAGKAAAMQWINSVPGDDEIGL